MEQTLEGSFSAISTPLFASKYVFLQHFARCTRLTHLWTALNTKKMTNCCQTVSKFVRFVCRQSRLSILATPTTKATPIPTPIPTPTHQQVGARGVIFVGSAGVVPVMFFRRIYYGFRCYRTNLSRIFARRSGLGMSFSVGRGDPAGLR